LFFVVVVLISSIGVYFDAKTIGARKGLSKGFFDLGPGGWCFACLLFWIIGFPAYLISRGKIKRLTASATGEPPKYTIPVLETTSSGIKNFVFAGTANSDVEWVKCSKCNLYSRLTLRSAPSPQATCECGNTFDSYYPEVARPLKIDTASFRQLDQASAEQIFQSVAEKINTGASSSNLKLSLVILYKFGTHQKELESLKEKLEANYSKRTPNAQAAMAMSFAVGLLTLLFFHLQPFTTKPNVQPHPSATSTMSTSEASVRQPAEQKPSSSCSSAEAAWPSFKEKCFYVATLTSGSGALADRWCRCIADRTTFYKVAGPSCVFDQNDILNISRTSIADQKCGTMSNPQ